MSQAISLPVNASLETVDSYLSYVRRLPRLSAEDENVLARRFREQNDLDAARQLVLANLRFVVHIARGYVGYGLPLPDLVQEGSVGLMKAVKRYDPDIGVRLVSFAVHWIKAEIHEFIIQNWRIVKIATTKAQRKLFFNLRRLRGQMNWLRHDEAESVAGELGVDVASVYEMENRLSSRDIAFEPQDDDDGEKDHTCPSHYLCKPDDDPALAVEESQWGQYSERELVGALNRLDDRSRDIVSRRWLSEEKATLGELAERHNISAERVRQIEVGALNKLRAAINTLAV